MNKPTAKELWEYYSEGDEGWEEVDKILDDSWRHGNYVTTVMKRKEDNTYWAISYQVTGDGEYNTWRDEADILAHVTEVWPKEITKIEYVTTKPENK